MTKSETDLLQARDWHRQGDIARALPVYEAIVRAEPDNAQAWHLWGVAALQQGDAAKAKEMIVRAIGLHEGDPQFHNNLGEAMRALGDHGEALQSYRRARHLAPGFAIAIRNEGAANIALGHGPEAIQCFRAAVEADGDDVLARVNLGLALLGEGDREGALNVLAAALILQPDNLEITQYFALAAAGAVANAQVFSGATAAAVETLFQGAGLDLQKLVRPALSILAGRGVQNRLQKARDGDIASGIHDDDLNDPLLHALLARTVIANAAVEAILRHLRRLCLTDRDLIRRIPDFAAALAQQCFITDYAYEQSAEETAAVGDLCLEGEALLREGHGSGLPTEIFISIAMYRPLGSLAGIEALTPGPELGALVRQQVTVPAQEAALAASVGSVAGAGSAANSAVRQQYEEAPYPRWLSTDRKIPVPLATAMAGLFPGKRLALAASLELEVLVAGCGTGKHAIDVAGRYQGAKVTAIDISRASLGYARCMAEQESIGNIEFLSADIMTLGPWQRQFDLIESAGVLHHLSDPEAGWRILCGLLAPHGLMKVALYSALGRRDLRAAREFTAAGHGNVTAARIRQARADILALPAADQRRRALQFTDFYSLRGCRDLLFNVQEREYDLMEIDAVMGRLGLDFIGFQFADINTPARFKAAYPDADLDDLSVWHDFELANQDTFSSMYQFWCRAKAPIVRDRSQK